MNENTSNTAPKVFEIIDGNTLMAQVSGASLKEVQDWAGHNNISTTADIYAHIQTQNKKRLTDCMGSILEGKC